MKSNLVSRTKIWMLLLIVSVLIVLPMEVKASGAKGNTIMQKVSSKLMERKENNVLEGTMPCRGDAHLLVVNFVSSNKNDESFSTEHVEELMFGHYDRFNNGKYDENITEYFKNISYGKLNVTGEVFEYVLDEVPTEEYDGVERMFSALDSILAKEDISRFDQNHDNYFDGIVFIYPHQEGRGGGVVRATGYSYGQYSAAIFATIYEENEINLNWIIEHETIHLMGLGDIYAGVHTNPDGTYADSLMDGIRNDGNEQMGMKSNDIPGIMKFFFGWIDELQEVSINSSDLYELSSYSTSSNAMVIYPQGDTESKFIFFVECLTADNNHEVLWYMGEGGLRIWAVYLSIDDEYNIAGNPELRGQGNAPYSYLEARHNGEIFLLREGWSFSEYSYPSNEYYTEFIHEGGGCIPTNSFASGVRIYNMNMDGTEATFNVMVKDEEHSNHIWGTEYIVDEPGMCDGKEGIQSIHCTKCFVRKEDSIVAAPISHFWYTYGDDINPTCTEDGTRGYVCDGCGISKTEKIPAKHSMGAWIEVIAPTTKEEGREKRSCKNCGYEETRTIAKLENQVSFPDVFEDTYYYDAVLWAASENLVSGYPDGRFGTDDSCTRAQAVTFLWRVAGEPKIRDVQSSFPDVDKNDWFYDAVCWAVSEGIVSGYPDGRFGPEDLCTRSQIVTLIWRMVGEPKSMYKEEAFEDVDKGDWFYDAVLWAVDEEITNGYPNGNFGSNDFCTRSQIVTFLYREFG